MKKFLSIILIFAMLFSMFACGKKYSSKEVAELIDNIGEVTSKSGDDIAKAEAAYDSLSDEQKKEVSNHIKLLQAKTDYEGLIFYLEIKELEAVGKTDEIEVKIAEAKSKGEERYWEYTRILGREQRQEEPTVQESQPTEEKQPTKGNVPVQESPTVSNNDNPIPNQQSAEAIAKKLVSEWGEEYADCVSEDGTKIALPKYAADGISYKELEKAYSRNGSIVFTVLPKTDEEHWNNIKYSLLTGNWDYKQVEVNTQNMSKYEWTAAAEHDPVYQAREGQYFECGLDPALLGSFMGGVYKLIFFYQDGTYHMATADLHIDKLPTQQEFRQYAIDAYKVAKSQFDGLRKTGKIKNDSSEYERAKAWSDWLCSINMTVNEAKDDPYYMHSSSAYGALVLHSGACGSRTAAYCLAMNMEGIQSYGLVNGDAGHPGSRQGHIVPWVLLNGKEYIYEYNMGWGLLPVEKETASAGSEINAPHLFQEYTYNTILQRAGLDYDTSFSNKKYMNEKGESFAETEI